MANMTDFERLYQDLDNMFGKLLWANRKPPELGRANRDLTGMAGYRMPLFDVRETEQNVLADIEIPGTNKEDIDLNVAENEIELKVEKKQETEMQKQEGYSYSSASASYYRKFPLPAEVKSDEAKATYSNGVLHIEAPKTESSQNKKKKIEIQ